MLDERIRYGYEALSNRLSRRGFLETGAKGIFATLAATAIGQLGTQPVLANLGCCPISQQTRECAQCSLHRPAGRSVRAARAAVIATGPVAAGRAVRADTNSTAAISIAVIAAQPALAQA